MRTGARDPRGPIGTALGAVIALASCISHDVNAVCPAAQRALNWSCANCGHGECSGGRVCVSAQPNRSVVFSCRVPCDPRAASSCPAPQRCEVDADAPDRGTCVAPCSADSDCLPGFACDATTRLCRCANDASCAGASIHNASCVAGVCTPTCATDGECPCGSLCADGQHCSPGCNNDTDCCGDARCTNHRCGTPAAFGVGSRCALFFECGVNLICIPLFARGECVATPEPYQCSGQYCPCGPQSCSNAPGTVCVNIGNAMQPLPACVLACTPGPDASCPPFAACYSLITDPTRGACVQSCVGAQCFSGGHCDSSSGVCTCSADSFCTQAWTARATCNRTGACVCTPTCNGATTGDDGCGGACGF